MCVLKRGKTKVYNIKSFLNVQIFCYKLFFLFFFYLIHITRWLILYILFKQKFSLPCAIQLECYFNLVFPPIFVYLIKPNSARNLQ